MEVKERVLDTAIRMFADLGIKSVRMDDIASACGISKRTLYEQFTDRENLVRQAIETYVKQQEAMLAERIAQAENAIDEMWFMSGHGSEFKTSARNLMIDLLRFYPQIFEDIVRGYYEKIVGRNESCLRRGKEQGLFLPWIDTDIMARGFTRYLYGLHRDFSERILAAGAANEGQQLDEMRMLMMLFVRGITTEQGRLYIDAKMENRRK